MTQAFSNTNLKAGLCNDCDCETLVPVVTFVYVPGTPEITFSQASTIPAGDTFSSVIVHVSDRDGNVKHGRIATAGGNTGALSLTGFDLASLDIKATVNTTLGCTAEVYMYDVETGTTEGTLNA